MIRKSFLLVFTLLMAVLGFSQEAYDECDGAINLGEGPACPETVFTNIDATTSTIYSVPDFEIPSCWDDVGNDVWASFTVPADGSYVDFQITVNGSADGPNMNPMVQPRIALYRGECSTDGMVELACEEANAGSGSVQLDIEGLTPGKNIF